MRGFFAGKENGLVTAADETPGFHIWKIQHRQWEKGERSFRIEEAVTFLYLHKGSIVCQVDQDQVMLDAGEGLFINRCNAYRFTEREEACELFVICVEETCLKKDPVIFAKYIQPLCQSEDFFYLKFAAEEEGLQDLREMTVLVCEKEDGYELQLWSILLQLWRRLYMAWNYHFTGTSRAKLREKNKLSGMLCFLHEHYKEKITLKEMAEHSGVSTGEYCRFFKKKMQQTPVEYLQRYRIEQSLWPLLENTESIADIAMKHGFTGASYYSETFKKEMGCTPGEYRKRYQGSQP